MAKSSRALLTKIAVIFAVLFSAAAAGQYWFVSHQLQENTRTLLWKEADAISQDIAFKSAWNLMGYRRVSEEGTADMYTIVSATGTVVDAVSYAPGILAKARFPFTFKYDQPFRAMSDVGEEWLFYVHKLKDGAVILGIRTDGLPQDIEQRFRVNVQQFAGSASEAAKVEERRIDSLLDYAVIDESGNVLQLRTGIPFKVSPPLIHAEVNFTPNLDISGSSYALLENPIFDQSGRAVGAIRVFEDLSDQQRVLHMAGIFNVAVACTIWLATVYLLWAYLPPIRDTEISCAQIPLLDESNTVEFKSSLRWDVQKAEANSEVEQAALKTIAGFLNSDQGGTLIIGVNDQKEVLGLEADYSTFRSVKRDRDGFEQTLRQTAVNALGETAYAKCVRVRFCSLSGKEICVVRVVPSTEPVFMNTRSGPTMYVRMGNATRPLNAKDAVSYSAQRWSTSLLHRRETVVFAAT
jgi:hypothetical protein